MRRDPTLRRLAFPQRLLVLLLVMLSLQAFLSVVLEAEDAGTLLAFDPLAWLIGGIALFVSAVLLARQFLARSDPGS